jgi:hypothetical protein
LLQITIPVNPGAEIINKPVTTLAIIEVYANGQNPPK